MNIVSFTSYDGGCESDDFLFITFLFDKFFCS